MNTTKTLLSFAMILLLAATHAFAQETEAVLQPDNYTLLLEAIEKTQPWPAISAPKSGMFYTTQHGDNWPPLPGNTLNVPFWDLGEGFYLLDDREIDYGA